MLRKEKEQYLSQNFKHLKPNILCAVPTFFGVVVAMATIAGAAIGLSQPAHAVPSFARQTGQPCGTCVYRKLYPLMIWDLTGKIPCSCARIPCSPKIIPCFVV
jgi:hypothetical protein